MKMHGKKIEGPNVETVVIPRSDPSPDLVFKAAAVLDYDEFEAILPAPEPPIIVRPGGEQTKNIDDPKYLEKVSSYGDKRTHWMILTSLKATDGLEFETVKMSDPETWINYREEMKAAGLSPFEVSKVIGAVIDACGLNQVKIDEATKRFLAGQVATPNV